MTYRIPGTQVALPIVVSTWTKKPFYMRLSGAEKGSLLLLFALRVVVLGLLQPPADI
jgi:hypothetical protein